MWSDCIRLRTMRPRVSDGEPSPDEWMALVNHLALRNINRALRRTERLSFYELTYAHTRTPISSAYAAHYSMYSFRYLSYASVIVRNRWQIETSDERLFNAFSFSLPISTINSKIAPPRIRPPLEFAHIVASIESIMNVIGLLARVSWTL